MLRGCPWAILSLWALFLLIGGRTHAHEESDQACQLDVSQEDDAIEYQGCVSLKFKPGASTQAVQLFYTAEDDTVNFAARSDTNGYVSIGFASTAQMIPGWAVVAYVPTVDDNDSPEPVVQVYNLTDRTEEGVQLLRDAEKTLGVKGLSVVLDGDNGALIVRFSRPLDDGYTQALQVGEKRALLWARGPSPSDSFAMLPGFRSDIEDNHTHPHGVSRLFAAHGVAMAIAWLCLAPMGALIAQFSGEGEFIEDSPKSVRIHRNLQISAGMMTIVAWVFGIVYTASTHLAHLLVGSLVVGFCAFQFAAGFLRPGPTAWDRPAWKIAHGTAGRLTIILGWVNILLGLRLYEARQTYSVVALVVMGATLVTFASLTINKKRKERMVNSSLVESLDARSSL